MRVVIFPQRLYLSSTIIKYGQPLAGEVINGAWWWILNDDIEEAHYLDYFNRKPEKDVYDETTLANKWKHNGFEKIVYVPRSMKNLNDYNYIIQWAESQEDCRANLEELLDMDEIDRINIEKEMLEDDDDIPF